MRRLGAISDGRTAMPTTLPDRAARARHQRRLLLAELAPAVAAALFLLLLAWNMDTLETHFSTPFEPDQRTRAYNPMEPSHRTHDVRNWPIGWLAQR
jgi:hypothetical protein